MFDLNALVPADLGVFASSLLTNVVSFDFLDIDESVPLMTEPSDSGFFRQDIQLRMYVNDVSFVLITLLTKDLRKIEVKKKVLNFDTKYERIIGQCEPFFCSSNQSYVLLFVQVFLSRGQCL